jgi:FMN phosphatase YigB (HAD superfamily)
VSNKLVLVDIDNTLYDWAGFFAPSFRAMVYVLVRELRLSEEQVYEESKQVFARHGSLDYAYLIQELESVRRLGADEVRELVRQGRGAFLRVQRSRLQPYPRVEETLRWLNKQQVTVVGVTNSPLYRAQQRLYDLKLDSYLGGLVAWEGYPGDESPATQGYVPQSSQRRLSRLDGVGVPKALCKPNETHYAVALERFGSGATDVWAIGDSLEKDLVPAARLGVSTVWARYGASLDAESRDAKTLLKITNWTEAEIRCAYSGSDFSPDYTVDSIEQLREIVPPVFPTLF